MALLKEETSFQPSLKMRPQERDHISQTRKNLADINSLAQYAAQYQNVGWSPVALDADTGTDLEIDFGQPQSTYLSLLLDLALKKTRVSLAIRLEPDSQLFVLKVNPAFGKTFLDSLGDWRSSCIAFGAPVGNIWEHHFLVLPKTWCLSPRHLNDDKDAPLSVMGTGSVVVVPSSTDLSSQETWSWLHPPWQHPPRHPTPRLLLLLEEVGYIFRKIPTAEEDLPTWDDIYPVIYRSSELLQALLIPVATMELYYRKILYEALRAGFRDPRMLQGLLWHAPHGQMRHDPEAWQKISQWSAEIQRLLSAEALSAEKESPGWESSLAGPPHAGFTPDTETETRPNSPLEMPGSAATPSSPENLRDELNLLATLASELEQKVDELERQHLSSTAETGSSSFPSLTLQKNGGELEELRRALEKFLSKNQDLLDSK
jgi:hypothetical protein